MLLFKNKE